MTADSRANVLLLSSRRSEVEQRIDRFEEAWLQGQRPAIDDYLSADGTERLALLAELVHVELERRLESGEPARVEDYLQRFPELAADSGRVLDLLVAEHELRREREPGLATEEYLRRFPQHGAAIRARLGSSANLLTPSPGDDTADTCTAGGTGPREGPAQPFHLPGYDILEELGRGGMGIVYKARHQQLNRLVAIKVVLTGAQSDAEDRARFRAETEAAARMRHPNIVQLHEVGEQGGRPYCVMEYLDGGTLQQRLSGTPLAPRPAAELVEVLAHAIHAAHQAGVVHRDLKPANVLIADCGLRIADLNSQNAIRNPQSAMVKIADFGLAKRLDADDSQTRTGTILGTPSYMAPEQAAGKTHVVGPATDIYALGAILYELLTGRPPFKAALVLDTLEQVRSQEPVPPSRLQPKVPRDLETICLKCLHKEPRRRYSTAADLADDLHRFLEGKPVQARPVSRAERLVKWVRRQPAIAALTAAVLVVTAAGFGGVLWQWRQTEANLETAESSLYAQRVALADREWLANHIDRAELLLAECPPVRRGWEWHYLANLCHQEARSLPAGDSFGVAFSPDGKHVAAASVGKEAVLVWEVATGQLVLTLPHAGPAVAFSPNGRSIASATWQPGSAGEARADQPCAVKVWDFPTGKEVLSLAGHTGAVFGLAFAPDGGRLTTASLDRTVKVWDVNAGRELLTYKGHGSGVEGVAFAPNGRQIASIGADGMVRVWQADSGGDYRVFGGSARSERGVAMRPRGDSSKGVPSTARAKVWNVASGQGVLSLRAQTHTLAQVAFAPDGKRVAAGQGNVVQLWELDTAREGATLRGHSDLVRGLAFDADGRRLASASYDQSVQVWDVASGSPLATVRGHTAPVNGVAFRPDGQQLASSAWDGTVKLWDTARSGEARHLGSHDGYARSVAFAPHGGRVASASGDRVIRLWDAFGGGVLTLAGHTDAVNHVVFHPTEPLLVSAGADGTVRLWDTGEGKELRCLTGHTGKVYGVAVGEGGRIASAGEDGTVRVWDRETGKEELTFRGHSGRVFAVAFQPHGRRVVSAGEDRVVRLWDAVSGVEVRAFRGHESDVTALALSADGRRLASAGLDRTVKIWDADSGRQLRTLNGHSDGVTAIAFRPDGSRLVTTGLDRAVKVWDAERGQELLSLRGHAAEVLGVNFDADGARLAAACADGGIVMWDGSKETGR